MKNRSFPFRKKHPEGKVLLLPILLVLLFLATPITAHAGRLKILASFLPICIFTENVVGERTGVEVDCLLPGNVSPHDYQLRPSDMKRIAEADAVIINGLVIEDFIESALKRGGTDVEIFESSKGLPLIGNREGENSRSRGRYYGINPHTWVSPKMAMMQVENIADFLSAMDPAGEDEYRRNARSYITRLAEIHREMTETVRKLRRRMIVTSHNAFDYLARDIGLEVAGVIYERPNEEPSAGDITALITMMKRNGIRVIFVEPQFSSRMAEVVAEETGAGLFILDPVATGKLDERRYEEVMKKNIETLKTALQ